MVTVNKIGGQMTTKDTEFFGLSTDTKPTEEIENASIFYEMDTKKLFVFDEENKIWIEQ